MSVLLLRAFNVFLTPYPNRKLSIEIFCSFPQLIVCAAMYKLTPQYIVSYDQVIACLLHVYGKEWCREVAVEGEGVVIGRGILIGPFFGISRPGMLCLSTMDLNKLFWVLTLCGVNSLFQDSCNKFVVPHDVMKFSEGKFTELKIGLFCPISNIVHVFPRINFNCHILFLQEIYCLKLTSTIQCSTTYRQI